MEATGQTKAMILYDPACEILARHFLGEADHAVIQDLAQHIQHTIDLWFAGTGHEAGNK